MTTHSNYSLQNFGTSNTRVLTGISQPVSEIMALCNQGIISRENISGIDNSNGNPFSREKILGIDNSNKNLPLENEEMIKAEADENLEAEVEDILPPGTLQCKEKVEDEQDAKADVEAKKKAETEAKAKGEAEHYLFYDSTIHKICAQNPNLIKRKLVHENHNLYDLMFANGTFNIQIFKRFKEARTNTTRNFLQHPEFNFNDDFNPTRRSILSELIQISRCGLRAADIF